MQHLRNSKLVAEKAFYMKYDAEAKTEMVNTHHNLGEKSCYRLVHISEQEKKQFQGPGLFTDDGYQINTGTEFENDESVIVRRLSTLYAISNRPPFFDLHSHPTKPAEGRKVPHCIEELAIYPTLHYKTLFLTQDYSENGKYTLIINNNGRFEQISVDDRIPVHKDTLEPIWGLTFQRPWELILIKTFAKKFEGYHRVAAALPFEFIEAFSNATWKYYNLTKSHETFLEKYSDFRRFKNGRIILKTKEKESVAEHGFVPNSAGYQLVGGNIQQNEDKHAYALAVQGTAKSSWPGDLSFLDKRSVKHFHQINPNISLQRGFMISGEELLNNFSSAYITSERTEHYYTGYNILEVAAFEKKALHFAFDMPADGFFDFCIKQFKENQIPTSNQSRLSATNTNAGHRYLRNKYMLVRDNHASRELEDSNHHRGSEQKPNHQSIGHLQNSIQNSNLSSTSSKEYVEPRFKVYEIEYLKGYNKGEAQFLNIPKGRYILRFKSELTNSPSKYSIDWVASHRLDIREAALTKQEKVELLHSSIVSFMHKAQHYSFEKGKKTEMISYGNTFEEIGYGFVGVKSTVNCPNNILLQVDPKKLHEQGYTLKGKYKDEKTPFTVLIRQGEFDSVVFKLRKDKNDGFIWPTLAVKIWKKSTTQSISVLQPGSENRINSGLQNNPNESQLREQKGGKHAFNPTESKFVERAEQPKPEKHAEEDKPERHAEEHKPEKQAEEHKPEKKEHDEFQGEAAQHH